SVEEVEAGLKGLKVD
nr:Chain D, Eukaryotic translation initiation factor 4E transporter [Homo sapiens]